uniref:Uncharacterized protein n=1 Tax=Anguilla anguilla TaxID=7936 RepID=A0A0E9PR77_ANGAN
MVRELQKVWNGSQVLTVLGIVLQSEGAETNVRL